MTMLHIRQREARDDVDRLRTVAAILPTSLAESVRRLAYQTPRTSFCSGSSV